MSLMFWGVKIDNVNCERRKAGQQKEKESLKSSLGFSSSRTSHFQSNFNTFQLKSNADEFNM